MKILLTTPFFSNLGGSELETIHTANAFASFDYVINITIYVHGTYDLKFSKEIFINDKIKFKKKPKFLGNRYIEKINKLLIKKLNFDISPLDILYWYCSNLNSYDRVYIITKSTLNYYLPILKIFKKKTNIWVKYTTIFFEKMPSINIKYLSKIGLNSVTSAKQYFFFKNELNLENVNIEEILLFNESYAIEKCRNTLNKSLFDFGIIGRFSEEKQFEDAVNLIYELKIKGVMKTLIIIGDGSLEYYKKIEKIVKEKDLLKNVKLELKAVKYDKVYDFFDKINCFLITSKYEGGPNIGLEVMAYGLPILSYDVGAMKDRLANFPACIANDKNDLVEKALIISKYNEAYFVQLCNKIKEEYLLKYSNVSKIAHIEFFLNAKFKCKHF